MGKLTVAVIIAYVVFALVLMGWMSFYVRSAAGEELPITQKVVNCGYRADIEKACEKDARCCVFIEPAAGEIISPMAEWTQESNTQYSIETVGGMEIQRADEVME